MDTQEKELFYAILVAASAIGAIMIYFYISILRQQRSYRKLAKAKISAEITTLENERQRIAADLHDEVGPLLSAIKLQINNIEGAGPDEGVIIAKSSAHIDEVIKKMREISNNLLPNVLVRRGLVPALTDFITKVQSATSTVIILKNNETRRMPQNIEVNMYRIVQEIVHNTIKHACAKKLQILIQIENNGIQLSTADDGVGFDYKAMQNSKGGLGLLNLQSRTEVMGGEFSFESEPGKGTKYLFEIPFQPLK